MEVVTRIFDARNEGELAASIAEAAVILRGGGLVAFPTETVYGLGADATNDDAVAAIFAAKERPAVNPLIVHLADGREVLRWAADWPPLAADLAEAFWPGPLTIIVPGGPHLSPAISAGGNTVGFRVPAHPVALELLRAVERPIAAPSANRSNRVSPTSAQIVLRTMSSRIDAILDGGSCPVGIESTVVDATGPKLRVLRPGMITQGDLARVAGTERVEVSPGRGLVLGESPRRSPGLSPRHYAPSVPLRISEQDVSEGSSERIFRIRLADQFSRSERRIDLPRDPKEYAARLYWALHEAEMSGAEEIIIDAPPLDPGWEAIHDRISRAASPES